MAEYLVLVSGYPQEIVTGLKEAKARAEDLCTEDGETIEIIKLGKTVASGIFERPKRPEPKVSWNS